MSQGSAVTQELIGLTKQTLTEFTADPNLKAALITGSVAQGKADLNSDIDLMLYLGQAASAEFFETQGQKAKESGGGVYGGTPEEGFGVFRYVDGVKVDLGFHLVEKTEQVFDKVLLEHDVSDLNLQLIIRGIRTGLPLYGEDLVKGWLERSDRYPDGLQEAMIRAHYRLTPRWILDKMGVERDDPFLVYEHLFMDQKKLLSTLYALNREYHPNKFKSLSKFVEPLKIKPDNMVERFDTLYKLPAKEAVDELERLQDETLTLVETHLPEFEMSEARKWLEMKLSKRDQAI